MTKKNESKARMDPVMKKLMLICLVFAVFGGWAIKYGFDQRSESAYLHEICTEEASGTVIRYYRTGEYKVEGDGDGKEKVVDTRQDFPIYEYEAGGNKYSVQSERYDSKGKQRYTIGAKIAVRYAPGDPEKHYLPGEAGDVNRNSWLCIGFGAFILILCGFGIYKSVT